MVEGSFDGELHVPAAVAAVDAADVMFDEVPAVPDGSVESGIHESRPEVGHDARSSASRWSGRAHDDRAPGIEGVGTGLALGFGMVDEFAEEDEATRQNVVSAEVRQAAELGGGLGVAASSLEGSREVAVEHAVGAEKFQVAVSSQSSADPVGGDDVRPLAAEPPVSGRFGPRESRIQGIAAESEGRLREKRGDRHVDSDASLSVRGSKARTHVGTGLAPRPDHHSGHEDGDDDDCPRRGLEARGKHLFEPPLRARL